ncbi:MAG: hypothetical protein HN889_10755 [Rhodospirillaceae bacterium]|nr:hypothetical protein [Rhodospirillaceae bacterium]
MASLLTKQDLEHLHHQMRIPAFVLVEENDFPPYVRGIINCVQDNGEPVPEAKALRDGLSWAKKLHAATVEEIRVMGREYETLLERHPDNVNYDILNSFINSKIKEIHWEKEHQEWKKRYPEGLGFQTNLVNKAHKGDLAAQLKLARRLEIGHNFRQSNAMAYFWYKRALQNGGGDVAQTGTDRLFPHLSVADFLNIEIWTEGNFRPY